jgi:hypothetical protein
MQAAYIPSSLLWVAGAILLAKDLRRMRSTTDDYAMTDLLLAAVGVSTCVAVPAGFQARMIQLIG